MQSPPILHSLNLIRSPEMNKFCQIIDFNFFFANTHPPDVLSHKPPEKDIMKLFVAAAIILSAVRLNASLLINEISSAGSEDWVELTLTADTGSLDISRYYVTMYYGSNEPISESPVTIRNRDLPETPYDDRFVVVHFSSAAADETDATGDTNGNGVLDVYCSNYGLWNTDCVVAIDTDDDPSNGGIVDFVAFSNRDGSINTTIRGYIESAVSAGQWRCDKSDIQQCSVNTGTNQNSYSTVSRINSADSNSPGDFAVTEYATPGRENIISANRGGRKLFRTDSNRGAHIYGSGDIVIPLFIYEQCSIMFRVFNSAGMMVYSSDLSRDISPGFYTLRIPERSLRGRVLTGLYPVKIEGAGSSSSSETSTYFLVISR